MKFREQIELMEAFGFRLVRRKKHLVWKNADGVTVCCAATPSDWRMMKNLARDVRKALANYSPSASSSTTS